MIFKRNSVLTLSIGLAVYVIVYVLPASAPFGYVSIVNANTVFNKAVNSSKPVAETRIFIVAVILRKPRRLHYAGLRIATFSDGWGRLHGTYTMLLRKIRIKRAAAGNNIEIVGMLRIPR